MSIEYYQGGIEVELTSHEGGPIVSRTMPQDYEYYGTHSNERRNDSMHQPRRSYDASATTTIPVKRLFSFGDVDTSSMVSNATSNTTTTATNRNANGSTRRNVGKVWDAPQNGIEKENETAQFLRSYQQRPAATRVLGLRDEQEPETSNPLAAAAVTNNKSLFSHSELDETASDISSSAMGSLRRRNRISQIHAEKLLLRQKQQQQELKARKQPLKTKTSINEEKSTPSSSLKPAPKTVSFGGRGQGSNDSVLSSVASIAKEAVARAMQGSSTTETPKGPLLPAAPVVKASTPSKDASQDSSMSAPFSSSSNPPSPGRSVATNLTYSTGGSGRVYRTQISCSRKYNGRVVHNLETLNPDDLQIGRTLEGLENGFLDQEDFARTVIGAMFEFDFRKEPLHKVKQWHITDSTLSRLKEDGVIKETKGSVDSDQSSGATTATTVSDEPVQEDAATTESASPPPSERMMFGAKTSPFSLQATPSKEPGDTRFVVEKTASLQYKDIYGMASANGIIHFYEDRDEIWVENYNFCFASRRFKFLSG